MMSLRLILKAVQGRANAFGEVFIEPFPTELVEQRTRRLRPRLRSKPSLLQSARINTSQAVFRQPTVGEIIEHDGIHIQRRVAERVDDLKQLPRTRHRLAKFRLDLLSKSAGVRASTARYPERASENCR